VTGEGGGGLIAVVLVEVGVALAAGRTFPSSSPKVAVTVNLAVATSRFVTSTTGLGSRPG